MRKQLFNTVCTRDCYDSCSINVETDGEGHILSTRGAADHPITQGFLCPRGAKDGERLKRNRILYPHVRKGGRLVRSGWDEALSLVAERLKLTIDRHGVEEALHLAYEGNAGLLSIAFPLRFWNMLGVTRTDGALCSASGKAAIRLHYGKAYGVKPDELSEKKLIIIWGFNPAACASHLWRLCMDAKKDGAMIAVIDPRKSDSAKKADLWLSPRPGSDAALAYGIARHILDHQGEDHQFISGHTEGFEKYREEIMRWSPERAQEITGIPQEQIASLGDAYCRLRPSATMMGIGFQKSLQGAESARAVSLIPALLGLHRGFFYSNSEQNLVDTRIIEGSLSARSHEIISMVGLGPILESGRFKFLYISTMNPVISIPDSNALRNGLRREDLFVVHHDTHWTRTSEFADVVLPAPTWLEKDDLVIPWVHRYMRLSGRIVEPLGESRDEVQVMRGLAEKMGLTEEKLFEDPWISIRDTFKDAFEEGTVDDLMAGNTMRLKCRPMSEYQTTSGKIEFYSRSDESLGFSPLPLQHELISAEGELILLSSALPEYTHSQFQEVFGPIPARITIHPSDAGRLAIRTGDRVLLRNDLGCVSVTAEISDDVPKGSIWAPKHLTGLDDEPLNSLVPARRQSLGNGPIFNSTIIREITSEGK